MKNTMALLMLLVCVLHQADVEAAVLRKIYNNRNKNNNAPVESGGGGRTTAQPSQSPPSASVPANNPQSPPSAPSSPSAFVPANPAQQATTPGPNVVASENTYQQCRAATLPSFINNSMDWLSSRSIHDSFSALSPPSVLVTAAGNDHPKPIDPVKARASRDFDAIIAGSLSPSGRRSGFSQQGSEVHIMAPSDYLLTSSNDNGEYHRFGGTSGAAPLVTGSLAGFEWLSGYHPTPEEAKLLLKKTAIKTVHSDDDPQQNGVGMVNAYKLAMIGERLKEQCGQDVACFKRAINSDSAYVFARDRGLAAEVHQAFPECSPECQSSGAAQPAVCINKANVLKKLRKEAFLHPSDKELWRKVACIYASGDFDLNSEGILSIYRSLSSEYGNINNPAFCRRDADCTLSPPAGRCSPETASLVAMNKAMAEYHSIKCMQRTGRNVLCNNKCRCRNTESVTESSNGRVHQVQVRSRCVNSRCVISRTLTSTQQQQQIQKDALDAPGAPAAPGTGTKSVK